MFFKIPLDADLSRTSYRCYKEDEDVAIIEYNEGFVADDWKKISAEEAYEVAPEWFETPSDNLNPSREEEQAAQLAYLVMKAKGSATV